MDQNSQNKPASKIRKLLFFIAQIIVIGLLGWYLYQNRDLFGLLRNIRWQHIFWIIVFDTASYIVSAFINYSMLARLDPKIAFIDSLALQYVNSLLNKILPTIGGGAAFRGYYLKKKYQLSYTQFASTITGLYVISFSTTALIGILCLVIIYLEYQVFNWIIFLAFLGLLLTSLAVIVFPVTIPASNHRLLRILKNTIDSWNIIKKDARFVIRYMLLTILLLLLSAAYTFIGYAALGVEPTPVAMLYLSTLGIIMAFLNFTPDGIGVKEGIYMFSQNLVQIPQDVLVLGSLYLRGISMITTLIFGAMSYWLLIRTLKEVEAKPLPAAEGE